MKTRFDVDCLRLGFGCLAMILFVIIAMPSYAQEEYPILLNGRIAPGTNLGVGIDDGRQLRNWLSEGPDHLKMEYPGNLSWAALFITVGGPAVPPPRPSADFSQYNRLLVEMKGKVGGECVHIGVKDYDDPDDGTELKKPAELEKEWKVYEFDLSLFKKRPLNMEKLYVVTEFVFPCGPSQNNSQTVYVKTIKFIK